MRLAGKRALITGGGTGIGRATAELFAREGAAVMVAGRRQAELEETVRRVLAAGGRAVSVQGDVSSPANAERMVQATVTGLGGIDVLVNNAGIIVRNASVTSVSVEDWERLLNVDLTGVFLVSRFALLEMVRAGRGGSIVHVSSVTGIVGDPKLAPYNAAKGGREPPHEEHGARLSAGRHPRQS